MRRTREEVLQELERRKKLYFRNKRLRQRRLVQTMLPLSAALLLTVGIGLMGMNYRQQGITDGILGRPVQNAPNGGMISNYDRFYGLGDAEPVPEVSQDQKFDSPGG